jgi:hypothetical protein
MVIVGKVDSYLWIRDTHDPDVLLEGSGSFVATEAPAVDVDLLPALFDAPPLGPSEVPVPPAARGPSSLQCRTFVDDQWLIRRPTLAARSVGR